MQRHTERLKDIQCIDALWTMSIVVMIRQAKCQMDPMPSQGCHFFVFPQPELGSNTVTGAPKLAVAEGIK